MRFIRSVHLCAYIGPETGASENRAQQNNVSARKNYLDRNGSNSAARASLGPDLQFRRVGRGDPGIQTHRKATGGDRKRSVDLGEVL
ncbi:hypothetical protein AGIG_G25523 [Arapaima gigas]